MQKIERKLHKIDATEKTIGRLATQIATILRGKHKPEYAPHIDGGDIVEVSNIEYVVFTGKKIEQKKYYHYSGYPGGLKTVKIKDMFKKRPSDVLKKAVREMLPNIKFRDNMLKRLIIR